MEQNTWGRKVTVPKPKENNDSCKIKVKQSADGRNKQIEFSGNCTREQILIAKERITDTQDNNF